MFVLKFYLEKKYLPLLMCLYTMHRRPNQSHYDATIARKEAIEIFWNDKSISTEVYGKRGLLTLKLFTS